MIASTNTLSILKPGENREPISSPQISLSSVSETNSARGTVHAIDNHMNAHTHPWRLYRLTPEGWQAHARYGAQNPAAKLNVESILEMRSAHAGGATTEELSRRHKVSLTTAYNVVHRISWKHIQ
jgi:hypothetical protein